MDNEVYKDDTHYGINAEAVLMTAGTAAPDGYELQDATPQLKKISMSGWPLSAPTWLREVLSDGK